MFDEIRNHNTAVAEQILKGFAETDIEKANVGDVKVGADGITRVYMQLPNGKKDWRRVKKDAQPADKQHDDTTQHKEEYKSDWENDVWEFSGNKITKQQFDDIVKYHNSYADARLKDSVSYADLKQGETYSISQIRELLPDPGDDGKKLDRIEAKFDKKYSEDEIAKQFVQGCYPMLCYLSSKSDVKLDVQKIGELKEKVDSKDIYRRMSATRYEVVEVTADITIKSKTIKVKRILSIDKTISKQRINSFM